jgi:hypothetical protein
MEIITLCKINQIQKAKYQMFSLESRCKMMMMMMTLTIMALSVKGDWLGEDQ